MLQKTYFILCLLILIKMGQVNAQHYAEPQLFQIQSAHTDCVHPYCQHHKQARHLTDYNKSVSPNIDYNDRSDTIDILHYTLHLDVTDFSGGVLVGDAIVRFTPKINNQSTLTLDLWNYTIDSIVQNGQQTTYSYNDSLLYVNLDNPLNINDTSEVRIYYQGVPPVDASGFGGFYFQGDYAYNMGVGFLSNPHVIGRTWHPCFDNFVERAAYTFHITSPLDKPAHCNGVLTNTVVNSTSQTRSWEMTEPIPSYLACVAAAPYETITDTYNGIEGIIPIELVAQASDTNNLKNSFSNLDKAIETFEYWFGKHRWAKVGYSVVPFTGGAMEHATNISYPLFAVNGGNTYETLMAHELAHSWWGNYTTCETAEDMWINEGMASYCEQLFLEQAYGWEAYINEVKSNHYTTMTSAHTQEGGYLAVSGIPHEYTYGQHVYQKGAVVAHNLRWYLQDSLFRLGMSQVIEDYGQGNLSSSTMRDALTAYTGVDMTDFFNDWIFTGGYTHFELDSSTSLAQGNNYQVTVHIQQKLLGRSDFHSNVPLELTFLDQNWNRYETRVTVSGETSTVQVTVPFDPSTIIINEHHYLNQAREDKQDIITQTGGLALLPSMQINSLSDSAYLHVEHHWVAPDPGNNPGRTLSSTHFWSLKGILPNTFQASARLNIISSWDNDLINTYGTDSLVLLYRATPEDPWTKHPDYELQDFGGFAYFLINDLYLGDYAFANEFSSLLSSSDLAQEHSFLSKVYPNPFEQSFNVEINPAKHKTIFLEVYNSLGQCIYHREIVDLNSSSFVQEVPLAGASSGLYFLCIRNQAGKLIKTHRIRAY
ncbi:MAG: T9SS type A sorting domain-containing protein [Saprospiraceae bacterium]|nr:T9SS type A sorting domain-containing protein [Saprospiraceae bacterium]